MSRPSEQISEKNFDAVAKLQKELTALAPHFREHAARNESEGRLCPEVLGDIIRLRLHKLMVPSSLGGIEASIIEALEVIEQIAYADASTGWVVFASGFCTSTAAAYLSDDAVSKIFTPGALGLIAGAGAPTGKATLVDGGYALSGKWSYGSGILHADWAHAGAFVFEGGKPRLTANGAPEHLLFHVPISEVTFEGNWDVLGLRATGSVDYSIADAFVPNGYAYPAYGANAHRRSEIFNQGLMSIVSLGHAAWAAGVGRRMLDELAAYAKSKGLRAGSLATSDSFWERFAEAEARMRSARALLHETWSTAEEKLLSGNALTTRDTTLVRLSLANITYAATEVGEFAYRVAGGESLRSGTMQRIYRDIHSGSQHITSSASIVKTCGRELAGLAQDEFWILNDLVKLPKKDV